MERWLPCVGFEGYYEISDLGRVRTVSKTISFKNGIPSRVLPMKLMKLQTDKLGYIRVRFCINKFKTTHKVHRLVAKAFIPNPENLPQVNHKDGVKSNNRLSNLEWCTNGFNQDHALGLGLRLIRPGRMSARFTGSVQAFNSEGVLVAIMSGNKAMAEHGFDFRLVSKVLMGKTKTHKGCTFIKLKDA